MLCSLGWFKTEWKFTITLLTVLEYFQYLTQYSFKNSSLISWSSSISDMSASFRIQSTSDHSCSVFHLSTDLEPTWFHPARLLHLSCVKHTQRISTDADLPFLYVRSVSAALPFLCSLRWWSWISYSLPTCSEKHENLLSIFCFTTDFFHKVTVLPTVGPLDPCWFISLWIHMQFQPLVINGFIMCPLRVIWVWDEL